MEFYGIQWENAEFNPFFNGKTPYCLCFYGKGVKMALKEAHQVIGSLSPAKPRRSRGRKVRTPQKQGAS